MIVVSLMYDTQRVGTMSNNKTMSFVPLHLPTLESALAPVFCICSGRLFFFLALAPVFSIFVAKHSAYFTHLCQYQYSQNPDQSGIQQTGS